MFLRHARHAEQPDVPFHVFLHGGVVKLLVCPESREKLRAYPRVVKEPAIGDVE